MLLFGSLLNFGINNDRVVQINASGELSGVIDDPYLRKTQTKFFEVDSLCLLQKLKKLNFKLVSEPGNLFCETGK